MRSQCEKCVIRDLNSLNTVSSDELANVTKNKTTLHIKRGEVIFSEGSSLKGVYCLRNGKCKLTKLAPNGKEQIVRFIKKGELVGHRSVISNSVAHLTVTALEEMDVCFIPKNEILDLLPKKLQKRGKLINSFRQRLWEGDIEGIGEMIKINFKGKGRVKALNKWRNYFLKNKDRMQYSQFKTKRLPQGSGSVESAIRRVINLRLKSCGSFWKKENAEIYLFLRSQLICGRWNVFFENLINRLDFDEYQANIKSNSYLKWAA